MKKTLLGTTSLALIGTLFIPSHQVAAAPIQISVGGTHVEYFAGAAQSIDPVPGGDDVDVAYFDHHFDNEIEFSGKTTLDNGIEVGASVLLEGRTLPDDQIDSAFIYIEHNAFGRVNLGDENGAAYLMHYPQVVPTTIDLQETEVEFVNGILPGSFDLANTTIDSTLMAVNDNVSGKITYFTPRVAGFQFGASYAAIAEDTGDDNSSDRSGDQWNNVSLGLNFVEDFDGVGVALSGGLVYADTSQSGPADGADDLYGVNTGLLLEVSGFAINVAFAYLQGDAGVAGGRGTATERALQFDGYGYNISGTYTTGPWTFGAGYQKGKNSGLAGDGERNTFDQALVGMTYNLGAGVDWEVTGLWWDADGEKRDLAGIVDTDDEGDIIRSDGIGVVTGIALTF